MKRTALMCYGLTGSLLLASLGLLAPACNPATCAANDYECFTKHLRLYDQQGNPLAMKSLPMGAFNPKGKSGTTTTGGPASATGTGSGPGATTGGGTGGAGGARGGGGGQSSSPQVQGIPPMMSFAGGTYTPVQATFTDPSGCRPGGCFSIHQRHQIPGPFWTSTNPVYDNQTAGDWNFQVGFDFAPPGGTTDDFELTFYPVAPPFPCPPSFDIGDALDAGDPIEVGDPTTSTVTVTDDSGGGGGASGSTGVGSPGETCFTFQTCPVCSIQACSDGTNCRYLANGTSYPCSGCQGCEGAAMEVENVCCPPQGSGTGH